MRALKFAMVVAVLLAAAVVGYRYLVLVPAARAPVLAQLNDPDSALFRNERMRGLWLADRVFYCGEINAKNALGGYVGYRRFQVAFGDGLIHEAGWQGEDACQWADANTAGNK